MRDLYKLGSVLMLTLASAVPAAAQGEETLQDKKVDDPAKAETYAGFYRIVSGENGGEVVPSEQIKDHVVRITEDLITVLDADENALYVCNYSLMPGGEPQRLDMKTTGGPADASGQKAKGIIRKGTNDEKKTFVMLCYDALGMEYPEDFRTRAQSEENLFVLEPIPDPEAEAVQPAIDN